MSQLFKLYRLQQVDTKLDQAKTRLDEIESILNDTTAQKQAEKKVEETEEQLQEARRDLRRAEDNTQTQRRKIEQAETRLYSGKVKNPKELQDLQNESASLKKYLSVIEERQLEEMLRYDEAESALRDAVAHLEDTRAKQIEKNAALNGEKSKLQKEVERLENEREALVDPIPDKDLQIYQKLRERRMGLAVARVADKSCTACGSTLSSSLLQEARSPNTLSYCEACGRILYVG